MPEPTTTTTTGALLIKLAHIFPAIVGAAIALRFNTTDLSARKRASAFAASVGIAYYGGGAIVEWWNLTGLIAEAAMVAAGLFGLSIIASLMAEIPAAITQLRRKYLGDRA